MPILSPTDASASWDRRLASGFYPVSIFFSVWPSTRRSGQSCFFCARLAPADGRGSVGGDYISRKREFGRFAGGLRLKVREGHSDESNALRRREHGTDQVEGDFIQPEPCLDRRFHRSAASGYLKIGPFELHHDGPTARICLLAPGQTSLAIAITPASI